MRWIRPTVLATCVTAAALFAAHDAGAQPQNPITGGAGSNAPAPTIAGTGDSHRTAALELLDAMKVQATLDSAIDTMIAQQVQQNPQIAPYRQIMTDFLHKYMSYEALKPDLAAAYQEQFTEPEIREITAFYRSPTGQKLAEKTPTLTQKGMEIGQRRMQEHMPELQAAIQKAASGQGQPTPR